MAGGGPGGEFLEDEGPQEDEEGDARYSRREWRSVAAPVAVLLAVVALVVVAWYLVRDTGDEWQPLEDIDVTGSANLAGHWWEDLPAYGPHVHAINLTLAEGDHLVLEYSCSGPEGGIQVRLQHPLHPSDGANGTGGTRVFASAVGGNGSIDLVDREGGAYQLYFWHPGSARPPGEGDDPDLHVTAVVSYELSVVRAHRP